MQKRPYQYLQKGLVMKITVAEMDEIYNDFIYWIPKSFIKPQKKCLKECQVQHQWTSVALLHQGFIF